MWQIINFLTFIFSYIGYVGTALSIIAATAGILSISEVRARRIKQRSTRLLTPVFFCYRVVTAPRRAEIALEKIALQIEDANKINEQKFEALGIQIFQVSKEFSFNGGSTLKDDVKHLRFDLFQLGNRLDFFFQDSPRPMFELRVSPDNSLQCVFVNRALCALVQQPAENLLGANWLALIDDSDKRRVVEGWKIALENKTLYDENQKIKIGKEIRQFHVHAKPSLDGNGKVFRYLGNVADAASV